MALNAEAALIALAACIQAIMAVMLWWQGRTLAQAAQDQAEAAQGTFAMSYAASIINAAEATRTKLEEYGLHKEALKLERAITAFLTVDLKSDDSDDLASTALENVAHALREGVNDVRDHELAERNALGKRGGAEP